MVLLVLFSFFRLSPRLRAQQADSQGSLNETQKEGRCCFSSGALICHSAGDDPRGGPYASLSCSKAGVVGNEDRIRETD